jgi:hypothetical protein
VSKNHGIGNHNLIDAFATVVAATPKQPIVTTINVITLIVVNEILITSCKSSAKGIQRTRANTRVDKEKKTR